MPPASLFGFAIAELELPVVRRFDPTAIAGRSPVVPPACLFGFAIAELELPVVRLYCRIAMLVHLTTANLAMCLTGFEATKELNCSP